MHLSKKPREEEGLCEAISCREDRSGERGRAFAWAREWEGNEVEAVREACKGAVEVLDFPACPCSNTWGESQGANHSGLQQLPQTQLPGGD